MIDGFEIQSITKEEYFNLFKQINNTKLLKDGD